LVGWVIGREGRGGWFLKVWVRAHGPHTHTRTHARTQARTHASTHPRTSAHTHAHTHERTQARTHTRQDTRTHERTLAPSHAHTHTYRIAHWTHQPCNIAFTHCKIHAAPPMPQGIPTLLPSTCIPRFPEVQMMNMLHRMQCTTQCDTTQCNTMFRGGGGGTAMQHARQCARTTMRMP
jgi:hypothetical protein